MSSLSQSRRLNICAWIAQVNAEQGTSMRTAVLPKKKAGRVGSNRPAAGARGQKRAREVSGASEAQSRPAPIRPRVVSTQSSSPPPSEIELFETTDIDVPEPSETDAVSQHGARSDIDSIIPETVNSSQRRKKTQEVRLSNDPEEELAACKRRIKDSKSTVYELFEQPTICWKNDPPTHHIFACKACGKQVPRQVGLTETSGLLNHARRCPKSGKQTSLLDDFGITGPATKLTAEEVREFSALWMAENARPFSIVKDRYLRKLLDPQVRKHMPTRATVTKDIARMYKTTQKELTEQLSKSTGVFHIALDMFQSDNGHDYLGIILFHNEISDDNKITMKRFLLECLSFGAESHTGHALAKSVYEVLCKFKIEHRVWGVVCDNASNNAKMVDCLADYGLRRLEGVEARLYCLLHILHLGANAITSAFKPKRGSDGGAAPLNEDEEGEEDLGIDFDEPQEDPNDIDKDDVDNEPSRALCDDNDDEDEDPFADLKLPEFEPGTPEAAAVHQARKILQKIAKFAHRIRFSARLKRIFKEYCIKREVAQPHNVRRDCRTRWNSTSDMTSDAERTFPAIVDTQNDPRYDAPKHQRLSYEDLKHVKSLISLLQARTKPLKTLTEILSRSGVPMLADVIVHFDSLNYEYDGMANDTTLPLYVRHAAHRASTVFNKYYELTDNSVLYRLAVLLHPSMRVHYLNVARWPQEWIDTAIEKCESVYDKFYKPAPSDTPNGPVKTASQFGYSSYMSRMYASVTSEGAGSASTCQVRDFVNAAPVVDQDADGSPVLRDPLAWWHSQRVAGNEFNGLAQMAIDVLSAPATSVDVERAFSFVGSFVSKRRHSLKAFTIQSTAALGAYSKAGLVKRGCLKLPRNDKGKEKEKEKVAAK